MVIITDDLRDMRISIIFSFALILFVLVCLMLPSRALPASFGQSHEIHWWDDRGPQFWTSFPNPPMGCTNCHYDDTPHHGNPYQFADMQDFANTTVCDGCHSQGGAYDGVAMGKANWDSGVYTGDNLEDLQSGKEEWCVTCHDDEAPQIPPITGKTADNVSGNDTSYGYFVSGHGKYNLSCTDCHDPRLIHIDSFARTYNAMQPEDGPRGYTQGYRLKEIGGQPPLDIPRTVAYNASQFTLCYSCHNESKILTSDFNNFIDLANSPNPPNWHGEGGYAAHLESSGNFWDSDRRDGSDSRFSCTTCHNPHGKNYQGRATFSMTRNDMGIVHKREVTRSYGYMNIGDWDINQGVGGDLDCDHCHPGPGYGDTPSLRYIFRYGTPPPEQPAFWTKLDSGDDVTSPTYGTGGTLLPAGGSFLTYDRYGETETGLSTENPGEGSEFPNSNLNSNDEFYGETIEFWYVPNFNFPGRINGETEYLFHSFHDANNWISIFVYNRQVRFQITSGGTLYRLHSTNLSWSADSEHHIVCTWGPAFGMHMYLDRFEASYSNESGKDLGFGINEALGTSFYIGNSQDGLYPALGIIDDVKIYGYQYQKFESDIALFSKLGSPTEVETPEIWNEIDGGIVNEPVLFTPTQAQHVYSTRFISSGALQFPTTYLNPVEDTIDLWFYPDFDIATNTGGTKHLFYCEKDANTYVLIKIMDDKLRFRITINGTHHTLNTTSLTNSSTWYHIVCSYGPDGMHIYINDKEADYSTNNGRSYIEGLWDGVFPTGYFQVGNKVPGDTARYCDCYLDELRIYGYQGSPEYLEFLTDCPVDIQVIDPLGRIVDKFQNEILGSQYIEHDFNSDGSLDDKIIVPKRNGNYTVSVFPEPGANPEDTYTLRVIDGENIIVLAKDEPVGTISGENITEVTVTSSGLKFIKLLWPKNGETLSGPLTFDWESVGYDGFRIQLSAYKNFKRKNINLPNQKWNWIPDIIYTPTDKEWQKIKKIDRKGSVIYWRVLGIDSEGNVGSSEIRSLFLSISRTWPHR